MERKQIAVLFGGQGEEHDVSCKSVLTVLRAMDKEKYKIHRIGITREGKWLYVADDRAIEEGTWRESDVRVVFSPDEQTHGFYIVENGEFRLQKVDTAYPALHGNYGEDGKLQGLFELAGIPYVGSDVRSSAICMDKLSTKIFVDTIGVRQANYVADVWDGEAHMEETVARVEEAFGYPVFVKPSSAGSSKGVSKADNREELRAAIREAKKYDAKVLIEEMIVGHEVECAILSTPEPKASYVGEILSAADFYDYDAKYNNAASRTVIDPDLPVEIKEKVRDWAVQIYECVGAYGLSRVDFFVEKGTGEVVFNEINTLPGFTNISMYPMLWKAMGMETEALVDKLIEMAGKRGGTGSNR